MITKNDERINNLFEELVPASGKAENLAGELIRAASRIAYRNYNDGDHVGVGYGKETCNPAARFLIKKGNKEIGDLAAATEGRETAPWLVLSQAWRSPTRRERGALHGAYKVP